MASALAKGVAIFAKKDSPSCPKRAVDDIFFWRVGSCSANQTGKSRVHDCHEADATRNHHVTIMKRHCALLFTMMRQIIIKHDLLVIS